MQAPGIHPRGSQDSTLSVQPPELPRNRGQVAALRGGLGVSSRPTSPVRLSRPARVNGWSAEDRAEEPGASVKYSAMSTIRAEVRSIKVARPIVRPCLICCNMTASVAVSHQPVRSEFSFLEYGDKASNAHQPPISVRQDGSWSYCGPSLPSSSSDLPVSFHEFAAATFTGPMPETFLPFLDFIKTFLAAHGLNHYMLTVRATTPTDEYDRPRWHTDELFFSAVKGADLPGTRLGLSSVYKEAVSDKNKDDKDKETQAGGTNWKICTTLLGPPTLFIPLEHQSSARAIQHRERQAASTEHDCLSIRCVGCASAAETVRDRLAVELARYGVEVAGPGQCAFFQVGRTAGAVHSEPKMGRNKGEDEGVGEGEQGRIFVNVVPGTEGELRGMMGKWGMEFPRDWWIGSNVVRKSRVRTGTSAVSTQG